MEGETGPLQGSGRAGLERGRGVCAGFWGGPVRGWEGPLSALPRPASSPAPASLHGPVPKPTGGSSCRFLSCTEAFLVPPRKPRQDGMWLKVGPLCLQDRIREPPACGPVRVDFSGILDR